MSTRKIADIEDSEPCRDPEHEPAKYMVYEPGIWEHVCPGCGKLQRFRVEHPPTL
jgi:hypothetical protein